MLNDLQFKQIDEIRLSFNQDRAIARLIADTYSADFQGRSFCHQRHHLRLLALQNGVLVGHVAVLFRSIRIGVHRINVMGLAEVATAKSARNKGIASELVRQALEIAEASTAEFVLLFGTEALYKRAGFEPKRNNLRAVSLSSGHSGGGTEITNEPLMICPVGSTIWDDKAKVDLLGSVF